MNVQIVNYILDDNWKCTLHISKLLGLLDCHHCCIKYNGEIWWINIYRSDDWIMFTSHRSSHYEIYMKQFFYDHTILFINITIPESRCYPIVCESISIALCQMLCVELNVHFKCMFFLKEVEYFHRISLDLITTTRQSMRAIWLYQN